MPRTGPAIVIAASALLAACASSEPYDASGGGIALRIDDDVDALDEAIARAEDHCQEHGRFAVLQAVSGVEDDDLIATFNCIETRGGGVALVIDDEDELDEAQGRARRFCREFDRTAVLQSLSRVDDSRVAAFNCVRA